jgi:hypothetical protein
VIWHRRAALAAGVWTCLVAAALASTLDSLSSDDFDGLNNLAQIPLAFPWSLLPVGDDHVVNAWRDACFGLVNAVIVHALVVRSTTAGARRR